MIRKHSRMPHRFRPRLEVLEDRLTPSAGDLDLSFGGDGKVTTDFLAPTNDAGRDMAVVQGDGKIVVVVQTTVAGGSDLRLVRYNANGSLDPSFGAGGSAAIDLGSTSDRANGVALQADGRIVIAGSTLRPGTSRDLALTRYNPDGSLDTSFGSAGIVATDFEGTNRPANTIDVSSGGDQANDVVIQADGKIVVVGVSSARNPGFFPQGTVYDNAFAIARYNADGTLDTSFSDDGKVSIQLQFGNFSDNGRSDIARGVALQADGKIVVVGDAWNRGFNNAASLNFVAARLDANGALDTSFSGDGLTILDFSTAGSSSGANSHDIAYGVAIQADGKIVAVGSQSLGADFALVRYNSDGSVDTAFDGDGRVTTDFGGAAVAFGVALQADGRIVAGGQAGSDFGLARYNPDGSLDTTFDVDGRVTTDFNSSADLAVAVTLHGNGSIVAAGQAGTDLGIARYLADGGLDTSFDGDGKVTTGFAGPGGWDMARHAIGLQADGKIVVAGSTQNAAGSDFALARYHADGSLDTAFGSGGQVVTDFGAWDTANGLAVLADGKIVVAGSAGGAIALARYHADGSLDTSFDGDGRVITHFGQSGATGLAIQPDGKIVVAGYSVSAATGYDFALLRYSADGSLDTTFDGDGKVTTDFAPSFGSAYSSDFAFDIAVQVDGKIVTVGMTQNPADGSNHFALARYNADGSLDSGFGDAGRAITSFGLYSFAVGVAIQADTKIVAVGNAYVSGSGQDFALARFNADGNLDNRFGDRGKVTTDFGSSESVAGIALQADGKIVAVGNTSVSGSGQDFALVRYNPSGSLDTSFGGDGKVTTDLGSSSDLASGVAIQPDGRIVAVGSSVYPETGRDFALVRYLGGGTSAQGQIEQIIRDVQALVAAGVLNYGNGNSLLVKLEHAIQRLDAGNVTAAVNSLQAFINEVNAFIDTGKLTTAQGQPMIDLAQAVIDQFNGDLP